MSARTRTQVATVTAERDSLRRERDELMKDKERLDWLDSDDGSIQPVMRAIRKNGEAGNEPLTYRSAIDAARQPAPTQKGEQL